MPGFKKNILHACKCILSPVSLPQVPPACTALSCTYVPSRAYFLPELEALTSTQVFHLTAHQQFIHKHLHKCFLVSSSYKCWSTASYSNSILATTASHGCVCLDSCRWITLLLVCTTTGPLKAHHTHPNTLQTGRVRKHKVGVG